MAAIEALLWDVDGTLAATERDGVAALMQDCRERGVRMAIATTTSRSKVAAARGAGIATIVTRSFCFADAPLDGALAIGPGLQDSSGWLPAPAPARAGPRRIDLDDLAHWCAGRPSDPQTSPEHS